MAWENWPLVCPPSTLRQLRIHNLCQINWTNAKSNKKDFQMWRVQQWFPGHFKSYWILIFRRRIPSLLIFVSSSTEWIAKLFNGSKRNGRLGSSSVAKFANGSKRITKTSWCHQSVSKKKIHEKVIVIKIRQFLEIVLCFYNFMLTAQKKYFSLYKFVQFT